MSLAFETLAVRKEGAVLFGEISATPMNPLGPELVRDLVSLIQRAEADDAVQVLVQGEGYKTFVGVRNRDDDDSFRFHRCRSIQRPGATP